MLALMRSPVSQNERPSAGRSAASRARAGGRHRRVSLREGRREHKSFGPWVSRAVGPARAVRRYVIPAKRGDDPEFPAGQVFLFLVTLAFAILDARARA